MVFADSPPRLLDGYSYPLAMRSVSDPMVYVNACHAMKHDKMLSDCLNP